MSKIILPANWVGTIAGAVLLAGCSGQKAEMAQPAAAVAVSVAVPEFGSAGAQAMRYPATIARDREADLSFRVGGIVTQLSARIGDQLAGQAEVARLDATTYVAARIKNEQEVAKLSRASMRSRQLAPAGSIAPSIDEDNASALNSGKASLAAAQYDEDSAVIRSPFHRSVVLARLTEIGETVSPGQHVLRVADLTSALIARAAVPQSVSSTLKINDKASFIGRDSGSAPALVRHVGAEADAKTGMVDVELTLDSGLALPSGMVGSIVFETKSASDSSARLPVEALLDAHDGKGHVFVVDPQSRAHRVEVTVTGIDPDDVRVQGIDAASRVISAGAGFVREGEAVWVAKP